MNLRTIITIILCTGFSLSSALAQTSKKTTHRRRPVTHQITDKRAAALLADRSDFKKNLELKEITKRNEEMLEARESLLYPADNLYGSNWDTQWVNPYKKSSVSFPDSFSIDCSKFILPVIDESSIEVTSKYGWRGRRMHYGIDLKVNKGDTIRAAFDGRIRVKNYERGGYGYYLVVRHPNGLETVYGHLSKFLVEQDEIVRSGDPIGLGGSTGRSTGPHLHFETRFLGRAINPAEIIDFEVGIPYDAMYVFHNARNGRRSNRYTANVYTSENSQMSYHRVKRGDTLGKIARMYGTSVSKLCQLNNIKSNSMLHLGQSIRCSEGSRKVVSKKQTSIEVDEDELTSYEEENAQAGSHVYHKIKQGDTLGAIANRYGTTVSKLCRLNGISKTTTLRLGRSLRCS